VIAAADGQCKMKIAKCKYQNARNLIPATSDRSERIRGHNEHKVRLYGL
jgi:protein subunit release factor A